MRPHPRGVSVFAFVLLAGLGVVTAAVPQSNWPSRVVRFIVSLGAGSGADIGARLLADRLPGRWNQPVIVENRPGGDALVAINAFVGAHDDHVLLFSPSSAFTAHPFLHDSLPYKPGDLVPITRVSNTVIAISVPVGMKAATLGELAALVRAQPGKLNWAGVTGANEFVFAGWLKSEGLSMTEVPYRNPVDAVNDLAEGRVQVFHGALAIARPQLQAGRIKVLAVTNSTRAPSQPQIPTVAEAGYPALTIDGLVGLFGPSGMPLELRERITADIRGVADATVQGRLTTTGQFMNIGAPEEFAQSIQEQRTRIAAYARQLGIKPLQQ